MHDLQIENKLISQFTEPEDLQAFNTLQNSDDKKELTTAAVKIAQLFGATKDFNSFLNNTDNTEAEKKLINSFHNNLNLLVQKTWVEKSDEAFKEQILIRIEMMCNRFSTDEISTTYNDFRTLLNDVVLLMFGQQSTKEDFTEYALRIDPGFGIFWWYLKNLPESAPQLPLKSRIHVLLGMVFLANY